MSVNNLLVRGRHVPSIDARARLAVAPLAEPPVKVVRVAKILEFPIEKRYERTRAKIEPDKQYSLNEIAEIIGIKKRTLLSIMRPNRSGDRKFEVEKDKYGTITVSGNTFIGLLDPFDSLPADTCKSSELCKTLGVGQKTFWTKLTTVEGRRGYPYKKLDGTIVLIPLYPIYSTKSYLVDRRALEYIERDRRNKQDRMGMDEIKRYLIRNKIDLDDTQLLDGRVWFVREGKNLRFVYPLLSGTQFIMEATKVGRKSNRAEITFAKTDVDRLLAILKEEKTSWIPEKDFLETFSKKGTFGSWYNGFNFTLDGKQFELKFVSRGKRTFIDSAAANAFHRYRDLKHSKNHVNIDSACTGVNKEATAVRKASLEASRNKIDGKNVFVFSKLYGIAINIRERSGVEKIHNDNASLARFYMTLKTGDLKSITVLLINLKEEIQQNPIKLTIESILKLWILRDHYMTLDIFDRKFLRIDSFFMKKGNVPNRALDILEVDLNEVKGYCKSKNKEVVFFSPALSGEFYDSMYYGGSPLGNAQESVYGDGIR